MWYAFQLAQMSLPQYSSKFSRKDFTLPQLFACLAVKEHMGRSYRGAEALLADSPEWCRMIGMDKHPDHNTLCRAARFLLSKCRVDRLLDALGRWAALGRILGLSHKPLAIDSTSYESHHVSRHYERRCQKTRWRMKAKDAKKARKSARSRTRANAVKRLPKLGIGVTTHSHWILSMWTGTGAGADQPHFEPLVFDAWRRVPNRRFKVAADAGYDSEANHRIARQEMGLVSLIPPLTGRPLKQAPAPSGRWRRQMHRQLATKRSRRRCGYSQRQQVETVNSMMKRNLGSALRGKTAWSRKRDMMLKGLVHDIMVWQ
jgi:hypothetical protein